MASNIILHHCVSARSFRPLWMMEEMGLKYTLQMLPFPPRQHARQFLEQNPLGTVPFLVDNGVKMTESSAMCQYLVDKYGGEKFKYEVSDPQYGAYLNFMYMSDATLTFPQTLVLRYEHFEVGIRKQPQVVQDYSKWFIARLKLVNQALKEHKYICSDKFTAADVSVGYALLIATHLGLNEQFPEKISEYYETISNRPAFLRSLEIQHQAAIDQGVPTTPAPDIRP